LDLHIFDRLTAKARLGVGKSSMRPTGARLDVESARDVIRLTVSRGLELILQYLMLAVLGSDRKLNEAESLNCRPV
jgi:hypothetical protein